MAQERRSVLARAAIGPAAAPPSSVMNSRRFMSDMGACSPALRQRRTPEAMALCGRFAAHSA
jgi:hypothetical protein